MNIKLTNFNSEHYATNLTQRGDSLKWESVGATHFMIIRNKFGCDISLTQEDIDVRFNGKFETGTETRLEGEMYYTILPRLGINAYIFPVKPANYAVFACSLDERDGGEELTVYNPTAACFYQCSVSSIVEVSVKKAPVLKKSFFEKTRELFKTEEEERIYYDVTLPEILGYSSGQNVSAFSLCYGYDNCAFKFPITAEMLNKTIQIPEYKGKTPRVESLAFDAYEIKQI
ncbi:MAG: hypothetical protein FWF94_00205 [Oscillospiraceae bacterium]|nr:hypothetical protein [Oscillospiraceae bacterium]